MTTLIDELQRQDPGSALVELFDIEIGDGTFAYFHPGNDTSYNSIQFRDRLTPTTIRTYAPLPIVFEGFGVQSDGPTRKPSLTVANVLSTFKDALGGLDIEELVGKKIYRRRTLQKYLYGESGDANPPVEYGIQSYIIDRKEGETGIELIFSLASPFDLDNVKLPRRQTVPNGCAWQYQGAGNDLSEHLKKGACHWRTTSTTYRDSTAFQVFFDIRNRILAPSTEGTFTTYSGGASVSVNDLISVAENETRLEQNGTTTTQSVTKKFRANRTGTDLSSPTLTDVDWTAILPYTTWTTSTNYYAYQNNVYSDLVLYNNNVWRVKVSHTSTSAPTFGAKWERIDLCGKRLSSCAIRYGFLPISQSGSDLVIPKNSTDQFVELPYGGFPASKNLNR